MDSQGLRPRIDLRWPPEFRSRSCSLSSGDVSSSPVNGLVGERLGWERYAVWSGVSSGKSGSESVTSGGDTATFERGLESFREPWKVWAVMPRTVLGVAIGLPPSSSSVTWVAPDAVTPKRCKGRLPPATGELLMPKDVHIRIGCRRALFDTLAKARGEFQSLAAEGDCSSQVRNLVSAFLLGAGRDGPYGLAAIFFLDRIGLDRDGVKQLSRILWRGCWPTWRRRKGSTGHMMRSSMTASASSGIVHLRSCRRWLCVELCGRTSGPGFGSLTNALLKRCTRCWLSSAARGVSGRGGTGNPRWCRLPRPRWLRQSRHSAITARGLGFFSTSPKLRLSSGELLVFRRCVLSDFGNRSASPRTVCEVIEQLRAPFVDCKHSPWREG